MLQGSLLKPHIPVLVPTLLESLSSLEHQVSCYISGVSLNKQYTLYHNVLFSFLPLFPP